MDRPLREADDMASGVREERERQPELLELRGRDDRLAAKFLCLLEVGCDVLDFDVERHVSGVAVLGGPDSAADAVLGRGDQAVAGAVAASWICQSNTFP